MKTSRAQAGEAEKELAGPSSVNPYAAAIDEAEGLDKIDHLQNHVEEDIYEKAVSILETYFDVEDGEVLLFLLSIKHRLCLVSLKAFSFLRPTIWRMVRFSCSSTCICAVYLIYEEAKSFSESSFDV